MKRALVLTSGGIDSTVVLAQALQDDRKCFALTFDYGQRHRLEMRSAEAIALHYKVPHKLVKIDPSVFSNSSLTSDREVVERNRDLSSIASGGVPSTYVPGRNTLFIAHAISLAESLDTQEIYLGMNANDHAPYPDCRPAYVKAYQDLIDIATKQALEGNAPKLLAPLSTKSKIEIVKLGKLLQIPFELTLSCYDPGSLKNHCGTCDACALRKNAFFEANVKDPTLYRV